MLRKTLLPSASGVATSQTAVINLPLGVRVHTIWLELGDSVGTTLASGNLIGQIRLKINGKVQRTMTGVELNALNVLQNPPVGTNYTAKTSGAGATLRTYLPIFLAEPWRKSPREAAMGAINAIGINSWQLEVDILAVTAPVLTGFYEWDPIPDGVTSIGAIQKWIRQSLSAVGLTQDFPLDRTDYIQSISMFPTTDATPRYVNKVKLTADGVDVQDLLNVLENQAVLLSRDMTPDTAAVPRFDLVFDYDDPVNNALPAVNLRSMNLHVEYNLAAAANMIAIIQRVGPLE